MKKNTLKCSMVLLFPWLFTTLPGQNQVQIDSVIGLGRDAIWITYAQGDGIQIDGSGFSGINIQNAKFNGVTVFNSGLDGVTVYDPINNGVSVYNSGTDGVYVENAGRYSMNFQGVKNVTGGNPEVHIAQIFNRSSESTADVLALKLGASIPGSTNNYVTFYKGDNGAVGRIEGNGSGGITYGTSGADYAECLPKMWYDEQMEAGDIVGVFDGKITRKTRQAPHILVITDRPAVLGNQIDEDSDLYEKVSFIGQVPVKVNGTVYAGDWIVASGQEDGTGIAIPRSGLNLDHQIVGISWETNLNPGIKKVNTAVGLDQSKAKDEMIRNMQSELTQQKNINQKLQQQIDDLKKLMNF